MAYVLSISQITKRPECEIGDVVAVYDFPPTSTESEIFDVTEIAAMKAKEIRDHIEKDRDGNKNYPKFRGNIKALREGNHAILKDKNANKAEIEALVGLIEIKGPRD